MRKGRGSHRNGDRVDTFNGAGGLIDKGGASASGAEKLPPEPAAAVDALASGPRPGDGIDQAPAPACGVYASMVGVN